MALHTRLLILIVYSSTFQINSADECILDRRTLYQVWEKKLRGDLLKDYKWDVPPSKCNGTHVNISFNLRNFDLDSESDVFTVSLWTTLRWKDPRLSWKPKEYGGVSEIFIWQYAFWSPEIEIKNSCNDDYNGSYGQCRLSYDGSIICVPKMLESVQCFTNLTDWPHDMQKCTVEFGMSDYQKDSRLIPKYARAVTMFGSGYGPEWTITDYEQESNLTGPTQLKLIFVLERNGESLDAILVFPSILLAIVTTSSILLHIGDVNRFLMMIFAVWCHLFYLIELGYELPRAGKDTPTVILFFRFSIAFSIVLMAITVLLIKLQKKAGVPPSFVKKMCSIVLESHGKYFIWPRWDTKLNNLELCDDTKDLEVWNDFGNIINTICLFISIVLYSILLPKYIPKPIPYN